MTAASGATEAIAAWAASVRYADLPAEVIHQARRILVDFVAATIAGSTTALSSQIRDYLLTAPGDQATVVGGGRTTAPAAAFANGSSAHGLELDDGYTPGSVHPGAVTVPAALAIAELAGASAGDLYAAIAIGVEITARIAAAGHPATLHSGFHNTAVAGVYGAAAAAAHVLQSTTEQLTNSLGIAGSHAGGLREYHSAGSDIKRLHAGKGARDGVTSAQLAAAGVTGPRTILEGSRGYFAAIARGQWDESTLLNGLGRNWECLNTYVKPYPCCRHLHGPIDAVLALRQRHDVTAGDVGKVEVQTFQIASRHDRRCSTSFLEAQLSIPFAVATTLRSGTPGLDSFGVQAITDPDVVRIAAATEVREDVAFELAYPAARPARVTLTLCDGSTLTHDVHHPLGEPANPIGDEALNAKFIRLAEPILGDSRATDLLQRLWNLDSVDLLMGALAAPTRTCDHSVII